MSQFPPPAHNWLDGAHQPPRSGPGWVLPMMVGAVIFGSGCLGGIAAGYFAGASSDLFADGYSDSDYSMLPFDATVVVTTPDTITAGVPFDITVTITDTGGRARTLDYVDWQGPMIDRLTVLSVTPEPDFTDISEDLREHSYETRIPASGSATVTFTVRADQPGPLTLELHPYLDMESEQHNHDITVLPAPSVTTPTPDAPNGGPDDATPGQPAPSNPPT